MLYLLWFMKKVPYQARNIFCLRAYLLQECYTTPPAIGGGVSPVTSPHCELSPEVLISYTRGFFKASLVLCYPTRVSATFWTSGHYVLTPRLILMPFAIHLFSHRAPKGQPETPSGKTQGHSHPQWIQVFEAVPAAKSATHIQSVSWVSEDPKSLESWVC